MDDLLSDLLDAEAPTRNDPDNPELPEIEEVDEDPDEVILLPYPVALCIDLWKAWTKHGVTATEYLAQPRAWRSMIHFLNSRQNRLIEDKAAQQQEQDYMKGLMGG